MSALVVFSAAERRRGLAMVGCSALAWSLSGVFARLLTVDAWTAICLRAVFGVVFLLPVMLMRHRGGIGRALFANGLLGWAMAATGAISMIAYIGALYGTSVANVIIISAIALSMGLAWIWFRESLSRRTVIAAIVALAGVTVMMAGSLGSGRLWGDMLAVLMSLTFATMGVVARGRPGLDQQAIILLTSALTALVTLPLAHPLAASPRDLLVLVAFAFTSIVLGFLLYMNGAKRIPAAEAGIISTADIVLAPLWVFVLLGENPGRPTLLGGAAVLGAVLWRIVGDGAAPAQPR